MQKRDLLGQVFGRLTVIAEEESTRHGVKWRCSCACGNEVVIYGHAFVSGKQVSCGCFKQEQRKARATHGESRTALYKVWSSMKDRCSNPKNRHYKNYGGRGVTVCPRWARSFQDFVVDLGPRPSSKHSLERIENDRGYEPENVRWATKKEQQNNMRTNRLLMFQGSTMSVAQWAEKLNIPVNTLYARLHKAWPVERALSTPVRRRT